MPLQMFPVRTFPLGSFLLAPSLHVVAWAEARTLATVTGAAMERFEQWLLGHFETGLGVSVAQNPALSRYVDPMSPTFSAARLLASMRLAEERLPGTLEDWGWGGREVRLGAGAVHVEASIAHYVLAGEPIDCWQARGEHVRWISRRSPAKEGDVRRTLEPVEKRLDVDEGDVFGIGVWNEVPLSGLGESRGDFGDFLAAVFASSAASGKPQGVVGRWKGD